jgi:hypothetical protein
MRPKKMTQIISISNMSISQIDLAIGNIDADFWAHASESELVEVKNRSDNHQSSWFPILLSPLFLFPLAGVIVYLICQLHPLPWHNRPWNIPNAIGWAIMWSLATAPLALNINADCRLRPPQDSPKDRRNEVESSPGSLEGSVPLISGIFYEVS